MLILNSFDVLIPKMIFISGANKNNTSYHNLTYPGITNITFSFAPQMTIISVKSTSNNVIIYAWNGVQTECKIIPQILWWWKYALPGFIQTLTQSLLTQKLIEIEICRKLHLMAPNEFWINKGVLDSVSSDTKWLCEM